MLVVLALGASALAPSSAFAQNGLGGIVDSVSRLDRNFDAADRNRDGLLSKDEAQAGHVAFIARNFDAIDTARRGLVSKDDVHAFIRHWLMQRQPAPASSAR
ncbi:MAG: EF-hand domain-containing protein [Rhodanobacter sp.]